MIEGKIEIFLSYKEPEFKGNILWLRPYLDKEGYELLYFDAKGWTPLINCKGLYENYPDVPDDDTNNDTGDNGNNGDNKNDNDDGTVVEDGVLKEIPDGAIEGEEGNLWEVPSPQYDLPKPSKPSCGCPNV